MPEQVVDISNLEGTVLRNQPDATKLNSGHKELPYDLPVWITVKRHLGGPTNGLLGWSVSFEINSGPTVTIKMGLALPRKVQVLVEEKGQAAVQVWPVR